jgi:Fic family protein
MIFESILNEFKSLHLEREVNYEAMNEILISHHSTAIEGSTLTEAESRLLITEGLTAKGKPLTDHLMMQDHYNALVEIVKLSKDKKDVTPKFIQEINANVLKNTGSVYNTILGNFDSSKGDFRKVNVHAGTRSFPSHEKVETMLIALCYELGNRMKNMQSDTDIYNLSFDAHFGLVSIHPFVDGNGRTARLLMNYILAYFEKPLAIVFKEDRLNYINSLEESRELKNTKPFRTFMYEQQTKFFQQAIDKALQQQVFTGFNTTPQSFESEN